MTVDEMCAEADRIYELFAAGYQKVVTEVGAEIEALGEKIEASDIPDHLAAATVKRLVQRMEALAE